MFELLIYLLSSDREIRLKGISKEMLCFGLNHLGYHSC